MGLMGGRFWIRSQDGRKLVQPFSICVDGKNIEINGIVFATFDSEESAIQELDAIERWLERVGDSGCVYALPQAY